MDIANRPKIDLAKLDREIMGESLPATLPRAASRDPQPGTVRWHTWLAQFWTEEAGKRGKRADEANAELEAAYTAIQEHLTAIRRLKGE